jgi:transaldolase
MASGNDYDAQLREVTAGGASADDAYWDLVTDDIAHAADILRPYYDEWGGQDGFVSIEVSPDLAHDTAATITQARELWDRLGRANVMIKIPATEEGIPAIAATLGAGINVNVTLIFSLARYAAVVNAFLEGLERRAARGDDIAGVASVASFFVSRVDTETDRRLPEGHALRGRAAVANAKLAYQHFVTTFAGARWDALSAKGARVQRPLWASTSTKNPAYSPTLYVDTMIGRDTVNTLAQASVDALEAGGADLRADTVLEGIDGARAVMAGLAAFGVDFDDVTATLEREGVSAFSASFQDAVESLAKKARELSR